ncbi:hypothetical protein OKW32_000609 [Paraburkholderia youngii]
MRAKWKARLVLLCRWAVSSLFLAGIHRHVYLAAFLSLVPVVACAWTALARRLQGTAIEDDCTVLTPAILIALLTAFFADDLQSVVRSVQRIPLSSGSAFCCWRRAVSSALDAWATT